MIELITNREIYDKVLCERVGTVEKFLWIATADIKDLRDHVRNAEKKQLGILSGKAKTAPTAQLLDLTTHYISNTGEITRRNKKET